MPENTFSLTDDMAVSNISFSFSLEMMVGITNLNWVTTMVDYIYSLH